MSTVSPLIQSLYSDYAINKDKQANALFSGRKLPAFVKDFIINRFTTEDGIDKEAIREYLATKMPISGQHVTRMLLEGEIVNITTRVIIKTELSSGQVSFTLPDLNIASEMFVAPSVLADHTDDLVDGENWGNISLQYCPPEGKKRGYVLLTAYKSFNPYQNLVFDDFIEKRKQLSVEEWIDILISTLGYNPEALSSAEAKMAMISRLLPAVESNVNFIELGPKSTGKSYVYNNLSQYCRMISGKCTRAQLVYNHSTKQYGALKSHDLIVFDEVSTLSFDDRTQELQNFLKSFLEEGAASLSNIKIVSSCGLGLAGNIKLTEKLQPISTDYYSILPDIFQSSAMLDRFHAFVEGWKIDKINAAQIYYGWAIDSEFFSEYMHFLRTQSTSVCLFDQLVTYDKNNAYLRHVKAIRKVATAYAKLLFPHITNIESLSGEEQKLFAELYDAYCLQPAIHSRGVIYNQCVAIDPEYKQYPIPNFELVVI